MCKTSALDKIETFAENKLSREECRYEGGLVQYKECQATYSTMRFQLKEEDIGNQVQQNQHLVL